MTPRPSGSVHPVLERLLAAQSWVCPIHQKSGDAAFYSPCDDRIVLPRQEQFHDLEAFYSTMLHEMAHSTGSAGRLDRHLGEPSTAAYGREELVAEFSAALVGLGLGVSSGIRAENVAYLEGLAEGAARETGLYLLGIERRAAGRSVLRAVHEAFQHGSGREWGIGASAPFVAGFLSAPAFAGALIAPKKHDLQGVASRAFLHVAAVHPSRCEGERYFLSGSDRAAVLPGLCQNSSFLRPEGSPLTRCLQAILIQSSDPAFCRAMNP